MGELANCSNCGEVYVKNIRDICLTCYEEEENAFEIVYRFLQQRKNRQATMIDIVDATKVEEAMIIKFIKEKRLRTSQFPMLAYACETCGKNITSGNICTDCSQKLLGELEKHEAETKRQSEREQAKEKAANVYYAFDKQKE